MLRATLVALLLGALALAPALDASDHLVASGALPGAGWAAARITTDGSPVTILMLLEDAVAPYAASYVVYDANGDVVKSSAVLKPKREFEASIAAGPIDQDVVLLANTTELDAFGTTLDGRKGEFTLVVWFAATASGPATWTLEGGPGVTLLGADQGSDSWVLNGADFQQLAGFRVAAGVSETPRAQVQGVHERVVDGRPVWWFFSSTAGLSGLRAQDILRADTPGGAFDCGNLVAGSSCVHFEGGAAGTYRWTADGAGLASVWLAGAAPRWP